MPRVYNSTSDPHDFCKRHFPSEGRALARFAKLGDGPDNRGNCFGYNDDHPPYEGEDYHCEACGKLLHEEDN